MFLQDTFNLIWISQKCSIPFYYTMYTLFKILNTYMWFFNLLIGVRMGGVNLFLYDSYIYVVIWTRCDLNKQCPEI